MKLILNRFVFSQTWTYKILKAKYRGDGITDLLTDYPVFKDDEFLMEQWDNIEPISMQEILKDKSLERRRTILEFVPLQNFMFQNAEVVDTRVVMTKNRTWDRKGRLISSEPLENVYELIRIHAKELFPEAEERWGREQFKNAYIYAVKVICPTTSNTFFINVASPLLPKPFCQKGKFNALEAIASTVFCPITNPKALYRQGDVMVFEHSEDSKPCTPYALTGEQYVNLLVAQS